MDAIDRVAKQAMNKEQNRQRDFNAGLNRQQEEYSNMASQLAQQQAQTRAAQWGLIQQLQGQAAGTGPSLAQAQLQQATDRNMQQAMAMGVSQRGAGQTAALHNIAGQRAGIGQQMAGDSAMLRLQEQMAAQQQLGGLLGGMYGQDMQGRQFGMGGQTGLSLAQEQLELARRAEQHQDRLGWEQARQGQAGIDYRNSFAGQFGNIMQGVLGVGNMLGSGLEGYAQIKKYGG